jgi:hypothetical protein
VTGFIGSSIRNPIHVDSFSQLEHAIRVHRIQRCLVQSQSLPMPGILNIIHRILATGQPAVEFLPPDPIFVTEKVRSAVPCATFFLSNATEWRQ